MTTNEYTIVSSFFAQDDPNAIPAIIGALPPRFGLLDDSPERWPKFKARMAALNTAAPDGTAYKVFFLGRHGEGWHNVAEAKYGTEAWDSYYSKLYGDSEITWGPDPLLTPLGISQAQAAGNAWLSEVPNGIPIPQKCYASPLHRALNTWEITFAEENICQEQKGVLVLENLREEHGVHTCDMRDPLSVIRRSFPPPVYTFEPGFTEEDLIWRADVRETKEYVKARARTVLDKIFEEAPESLFISVTAHGGIINGLLGVMGRAPYGLPTGGVLPLVVKRETVPVHGLPSRSRPVPEGDECPA